MTSQFNLVLSPGQRSSFNSPISSLHLQPPSNSSNVNVTGNLVDILRSPAGPGDIAFINCSGGDQYTLPNLNGSAAVLLYSTELQDCHLPANQANITVNVFSTLSTVTSQSILNMDTSANLTAQIASNPPMRGSSNSENPGGSSNFTVAQPTAMIALYSVAGVVLVLFFAVLIVGGIRAKRHPERYGVRSRPNTGPPRIRARGIAAAVLDTVSSVRYFGGQKKEEPSKDVELEEGRASNPDMQREKTVEERDEGDGPHGIEETMKTCPICCDDFQEGQEVRTLPCNHIFHPHCVDPWLLNLSGVCPMCRISLAPDADPEAENAGEANATTPSSVMIAAPAADSRQPGSRRERANVFSRYLDVLNNRNIATDQDRADAVRQLGTGAAPGTVDASLGPPVSRTHRHMGSVRTFFRRRAANLNNPLPARRNSRTIS